MGIIKKLSGFFSSFDNSDADSYWINVKCNRCDEIIKARVNLRNDLSIEYNNGGMTYFCRKTLIGEQHCFQRVEVELTFDANHRLINREITGGQFVDEES